MISLEAWRVRAKTKANEILREVSPSCLLKAPVPIHDIIEEYVGDVHVMTRDDYEFPPDVSAISTKDINLGWLVIINGREPLVRQRFSAAHELAHMALFPNQPKVVHCSHHSDDEFEKVCDRFAGHILMPETLVREFYRLVPVPRLEEIADAFKVSRQVAEIELGRLGLPFKRSAH